jgi:hypothetical protein
MTGYPFPAGPNGPTARTRQVAIRAPASKAAPSAARPAAAVATRRDCGRRRHPPGLRRAAPDEEENARAAEADACPQFDRVQRDPDRERLRGIRSGRLEGNGNPAARDPHVPGVSGIRLVSSGAGTIRRPAWMGEAIPSALAVAVAAAIRAPTDAAAHPVSMQPVLGDWPTRRAGRRARRGRCGRRQGAAHAAPFVRVTPARRLPGRSATAATRRRRRPPRPARAARIRERFPRPGRSRSPSRRGLPGAQPARRSPPGPRRPTAPAGGFVSKPVLASACSSLARGKWRTASSATGSASTATAAAIARRGIRPVIEGTGRSE